MALRFLGKNPNRKYVKQAPKSHVTHTIKLVEDNVAVKENKTKTKEDIMADERLTKIENLMGTKAPKRKVRVEKKEKGLIERTSNSDILLTEDNKMVLND